MVKHHLIISGTGRAGTTFLVQLLTQLGLDTGFGSISSGIYPNCQAGMEWDIRYPSAPYIVKSPSLCDHLDEVIDSGNVVIDHAIIPVRDLYSAAKSRISVQKKTTNDWSSNVKGGLWDSMPEQQEAVLACKVYEIIYAIAKHNIPITLLYFPRLITEPQYLYNKIRFALKGISYESFLEAFKLLSNPELIHNFRGLRIAG